MLLIIIFLNFFDLEPQSTKINYQEQLIFNIL